MSGVTRKVGQRSPKETRKERRGKQLNGTGHILISNEAADRDASPAHATHQAATHHTASQRLAPGTVAIVAVGICNIHGDGLGANKRVLSTAAHGRVEGTSRHGGVGFGSRVYGDGLCGVGGLRESVQGKVGGRELTVVETDVTVAIGDSYGKSGIVERVLVEGKKGTRRGRPRGRLLAERAAGRVVGLGGVNS